MILLNGNNYVLPTSMVKDYVLGQSDRSEEIKGSNFTEGSMQPHGAFSLFHDLVVCIEENSYIYQIYILCNGCGPMMKFGRFLLILRIMLSKSGCSGKMKIIYHNDTNRYYAGQALDMPVYDFIELATASNG